MRKLSLIGAVALSMVCGCASDDASEGNDEVGASETSDATDSATSSSDSATSESSTTNGTTTDTSTSATDTSGTDTSGTDTSGTDTSATETDTATADTSDTSATDTSTDGVEPGCGDGIVDPGEDCDDGNLDEGDGCSAACLFEARIVFATSTLHTGNLGGLMGADEICNTRAAAANLPGTYMAWISTDQDSPSTRFVQSTLPYVTVEGTKIADDYADLSDGTLDTPINRTETAGTPPNSTFICNGTARQTWTGTLANGTTAANTCSNFTSTASTGAIGRNTDAGANWSVCNPSIACTNMAPLYCFQQ